MPFFLRLQESYVAPSLAVFKPLKLSFPCVACRISQPFPRVSTLSSEWFRCIGECAFRSEKLPFWNLQCFLIDILHTICAWSLHCSSDKTITMQYLKPVLQQGPFFNYVIPCCIRTCLCPNYWWNSALFHVEHCYLSLFLLNTINLPSLTVPFTTTPPLFLSHSTTSVSSDDSASS